MTTTPTPNPISDIAPAPIPAPAPAPQPAPAPLPQDEPDPLVEQLRTSQRLALRESLRQASAQQPDRAAAIVKLATATRLHPSTVAEVEGDAKAAVAVQHADVDGLMRDHPELASWLLDQSNAAVGQDDLPGLRALDQMVRQVTHGPQDDPLGILPKGYQFDASRSGIIRPLGTGALAADIGDYQGLGADLKQRDADLGQAEQDAKERDARLGHLADPFVAGLIGSLGATIRAGQALTGADSTNVRRGGEEIAASSAEQYPGFGSTVARLAGGLTADVPLLLAGGPFARAAQALGSLRGTGAALAHVFGKEGAAGALERIAASASMAPLAARSGIVSGQEHGAGFGAVDALINLAIPGAFGRVGVQRALVPAVADIGKGGVDAALPAAQFLLKQSGLDAGQNAAIDLASAIHEYTTGADPDALNPANLAPRLGLAAFAGGAMGGIFNLPEAARIHAARQGLAIRQATGEADALSSATDAALASKAMQRAPDQVARLVQQVSDSTGAEGTIYAQGEAFREHYQERGEDPAAMAEAMGVDPATYAAAMAGRAQLHIPLAGFLSRVREDDKPLLDHMTLRPDALTRTEAGAASEQLRTDLERQVQRLAKTSKTSKSAPRDQDILDSVQELGGIKPRPKGEQGGEYDHGSLPLHHRKLIAGDLQPDQMAAALKEQGIGDGTTNAMWAAIEKASGSRLRTAIAADQGRPDEQGQHPVTGASDADAAKLDESASKVGDIVEEQLIAAGRPAAEAKYGALVWAKGLRTLAERWNAGHLPRGAEPVTPESLFQRYQVRVTGPGATHPEDIARQFNHDTRPVSQFDQPAYHGTPHKFDKFTTDHMGSGEGAQAYGWGLYFAGNKAIAKYYKENLTTAQGLQMRGKGFVQEAALHGPLNASRDAAEIQMMVLDGGKTPRQAIERQIALTENAIRQYRGNLEAGFKEEPTWGELGNSHGQRIYVEEKLADSEGIAKWLRSLDPDKIEKPTGRLYHVEIPEAADMLHWDSTAKDQPDAVRALIEKHIEGLPEQSTGAEIYRDLGEAAQTLPAYRAMPRDKAASLFLLSKGIKGIRFLDGPSRAKGEGHHNYVIFDGADVAIREYEQPGDDTARGRIRVGRDTSLSISLLAGADRSTFVHETGHAYLEILSDLAGRDDAPLSVKSDLATIREWVGATEPGFTVDQHEQFARGFEAYLMEGKAPSSALRRAFHSFAKWLTDLYLTIANLRITLTPEVRTVFNRLLASDDEIAAVGKEMHAEPFFTDAKAAGMAPAEFARYQRDAAEAKIKAADSLRAEVLSLERAHAVQEREEAKGHLEKLIGEAVDSRPDMQAIAALQDGVEPKGSNIPFGTLLKLDRGEIVQAYGEQTLKDLPGPRTEGDDGVNSGRRVYAAEGGLSLADAATLFGFKDGNDLIAALIKAPDRDTFVQQRVAEEMAKRFPDKAPAEVQADAQAKLADELAEHQAADELDALERIANQPPTPRQVIRQAAQRTVEGMVAHGLRPDVYRVAAQKARERQFALQVKLHEAEGPARALLAEEVAGHAREALMNMELFRAARTAKDRGEKDLKWIKQRDTLDAREKMGKAGGWEFTVRDGYGDPTATFPSEQEALAFTREHPGTTFDRTSGYLEQWDAIQEGFSLKRASTRALRRRESLRQWVSRQEADGEPVNIPDEIIDDLGKKRWQELTVADQKAVTDSLRNVYQLATKKNVLVAAKRRRDLEALAGDLATSIDKHASGTVAARLGTTGREKIAEGLGGFLGSHDKDSFTVRAMDGDVDGGPLWEAVILPRHEAMTAKAKRLAEAGAIRHEDLQVWLKGGGKAGASRDEIPGTALRLTREQRIGMALYWGNREGRQRVLADLERQATPGTERDVQAVLDSLDANDWQLVRSTWKQVNSYWHEIASLERRTVGVAPEKVEALPFQAKNGGTLEGGYHPIKYDHTQGIKATNIDDATDAKSKLRAANVASTTRRGFTKQRADAVQGRGLRYDFGVMAEHLNEVVHDLTHREMLQDQNRIFRNEKIAGAIVNRYGKRVLDQLVNTTADIAQGEAPAKSAAERFSRTLRKGVSAAAFGFNLTSALANATGILQAIPRVGAGRTLQALAHVTGTAARMKSAFAEAEGRSVFMQTRAQTFMREVAEANATTGTKGKLDAIQRFGYWPMTQVQRVVDAVTWHAGHQMGMEKAGKDGLLGKEADERAVAIADQTVIDTQGSGRVGDMAAIQRGGEVSKLLTAFYTYFSTTYNLQKESVGRAVRKGEIAQLAGNTLIIWALPAVLTDLIGQALRGDTAKYGWAELAKSEVSYGLGMLVGFRELSGVVQGHSYSGPGSLGLISRAGQLITQAGQGELDGGLLKAAAGTALSPFGFPAVELGRLVDGITMGWEKGDYAGGLRAALFGKPRTH